MESAKQKYNFLFTHKPFAGANRVAGERFVKNTTAFACRRAEIRHKNALGVQKQPNFCPPPDKKIVFL